MIDDFMVYNLVNNFKSQGLRLIIKLFRVQSAGVRPNKQNAREWLSLVFLGNGFAHHHHKIGGDFAKPPSRNFGALGRNWFVRKGRSPSPKKKRRVRGKRAYEPNGSTSPPGAPMRLCLLRQKACRKRRSQTCAGLQQNI